MRRYVKILIGVAVAFVLLFLTNRVFHNTTSSMEPTYQPGSYLFTCSIAYGFGTANILPWTSTYFPYKRFATWQTPKLYDPVAFRYPGARDEVVPEKEEIYCKRCMGEPGDEVKFIGGVPYVNGVNSGKHTFVDKQRQEMLRTRESDGYCFPASSEYSALEWGPMRVPAKGDVIDISGNALRDWAVFITREGHEVSTVNHTVDGSATDSYTVEYNYLFMAGDNSLNSIDSRFIGFVREDYVIGKVYCVLGN